MEEFNKIKWSWNTARSTKESDEYYDTNLSDRRTYHTVDQLQCHLLEIHPINKDQDVVDSGSSTGAAKKTPGLPKDPRTGREAPQLICDYSHESVPPEQEAHLHDTSHFTAIEQRQCINAIGKLHTAELTDAEKANVNFYHAVADLRREEKNAYLKRVQMHFDCHLSKRCTKVHPALHEFVMNKWKYSVVNAMRMFADRYYRLQAGLPLATTMPGSVKLQVKRKHAFETGHVPRARNVVDDNKRYIQKSAEYLTKSYEAAQAARHRENIRHQCIALADEHCVDVILPLSALCLLLDPSSAETNWMIDFRIDDLPVNNVFQRQCRITIGKPLPRTTIGGLEMHRVAFKHMARLHMLNKPYYSFENRTSEQVAEAATEPTEYRCVTFDDYLRAAYEQHKDWTKPRGNTLYNVYELSDAQSSMNILVTSKQDGYRAPSLGSHEFVNFSTKVEYQSEFGAEQMTKSELLREWCRAVFRSDAAIQRLRVDVTTHRIVQSKDITVSDIERDLQRLYQINPHEILENLQNMLKMMQKFPSGEYLFRHETKHNNQVMVYVKTDDRDAFHLPKVYASLDFQKAWSDTPHWLPIDDTEITIVHRKGQVMPCAFPHYRNTKKSKRKRRGNDRCQQSINPPDDREQILRRITMEQQNEANTAKAKQKFRNQEKKRRHREKQKVARLKKTAMDKEYIGETLDPYLMFDPSGNVSIFGLVEKKGASFARTRNEAGGMGSSSNALERAFVMESFEVSNPEGNSKAKLDTGNDGPRSPEKADEVGFDLVGDVPILIPALVEPTDIHDRPTVDQAGMDIFTDSSPPRQPEPMSPVSNQRSPRSRQKRVAESPTSPSGTITRSGRLVRQKQK